MASTNVTVTDILDAIAAASRGSEEGMTTSEIIDATGLSGVRVRALIKRGLASGQLRATKKYVVSPLSGARAPAPAFVVVPDAGA